MALPLIVPVAQRTIAYVAPRILSWKGIWATLAGSQVLDAAVAAQEMISTWMGVDKPEGELLEAANLVSLALEGASGATSQMDQINKSYLASITKGYSPEGFARLRMAMGGLDEKSRRYYSMTNTSTSAILSEVHDAMVGDKISTPADRAEAAQLAAVEVQ